MRALLQQRRVFGSHPAPTAPAPHPLPALAAPHAATAALLPLLGVGRRLPHATLLQLVVLGQAACYALAACTGGALPNTGGDADAWQLQNEAYLGLA